MATMSSSMPPYQVDLPSTFPLHILRFFFLLGNIALSELGILRGEF